MAEAAVRAVVPRRVVAARAAEWNTSRASRRLPLPPLAATPPESSMLYRIAAVDERGRIAESAITGAVGWQPGERLGVDLLSTTTVAVRADPGGLVPLARRGHFPLPVPVRRWCGLAPGDRVLLAASGDEGLLLVHTMAALEAMVAAFHVEGGDRR